MKYIPKQLLTSGGVLVASLMASNVLNLLYNAYLGRMLSFSDFGMITFINTLLSFVSIFLIALGATVNHRAAYLSTKVSKESSIEFLQYIQQKTIQISLIFTVLWVLASSYIASFFKISSISPIIIFALVIIVTALKYNNRGYLQANLFFTTVAAIVIAEPISKLISVILLVLFHQAAWAYLSIPISAIISFIVSDYVIKQQINQHKKNIHPHKFHFPAHFFIASIMSGIAANTLLTFDIALVKHYLSPELAGEYSLLSLIGKMIYFISSLLNIFIITLVSRDEGEGKNPHASFYKLFVGILVLVITSTVMLGFFGKLFVPIIFGPKALTIIQFLERYALTIMLFTLANSIVTFQLARKKYAFTYVSLIMSLCMIFGIVYRHDGIFQIISTMFAISILNMIIVIVMHIFYRYDKRTISQFISSKIAWLTSSL